MSSLCCAKVFSNWVQQKHDKSMYYQISSLEEKKRTHFRQHISKIYEVSLTRHKHNMKITATPELCSMADLVDLKCSAEPNSKL